MTSPSPSGVRAAQSSDLLTWSAQDRQRGVCNLQGRNLQSYPFALPHDGSLTQLLIDHNQLKRLPPGVTSLTALSMGNNRLGDLSKELLRDIVANRRLQSLDLRDNQVTVFPKELEGLGELRCLIMAGNKMVDAKLTMKQLEVVDLSQNKLTTCPALPPGVKKAMLDFNRITELKMQSDRLQQLRLQLNSITSVSLACRLPHLALLDVARNRLSSLPDMTKLMPGLRVLDCGDNFLTEWPLLPQGMQEVSIRGNRLKVLPELGKLHPEMRALDLSDNQLEAVPLLSPNMKNLVMNSNRISMMAPGRYPALVVFWANDNLFEGLPTLEENKVEEWYMAGNRLRSIDLTVLFSGLRRLELASNEIECIPPELFLQFEKLVHLGLHYNNVCELPPEIAESRLEVLHVTWNPITELPERWPETLKSFFCGYCGISDFPDSFGMLPHLEQLVACGNHLQTLPLLRSAVELQLSRNEFRECPPLGPSLKVVNLSFNFLTSVAPFDCPELTDLDLSHNKLTRLPAFTAPRLRFLKVGGNHEMKERVDVMGWPTLQILDVEGTEIHHDEVPVGHDGLRELMVGHHSAGLASSVKAKILRCGEGVGFSEMNGVRDQMEDAIVVRSDARGGMGVVCVFDGHGGFRTAYLCALRMVQLLEGPTASFSLGFIEAAVKELLETAQKSPQDGCTAVITLRKGRTILTGHLGDARAVVVNDSGEIEFTTNDHKPTCRAEYERIRDMGSKVVGMRTAGVLAVARSIGDFRVPGVGYAPELSEVRLNEGSHWLIVACDGVWDVFTPKMIRQVVDGANDAEALATDIKNLSFALGSQDNISVIVVDLKTDEIVRRARGGRRRAKRGKTPSWAISWRVLPELSEDVRDLSYVPLEDCDDSEAWVDGTNGDRGLSP